MYVLRDAVHTYEIWDPYASRRMTATWYPLAPLDEIRSLAEHLARDEDNLRIMARLTTEHGGRAEDRARVAERFASLVGCGRLVLREAPWCPYPLPDPRALEPAVGLCDLADTDPHHEQREPLRPIESATEPEATIELVVTDDLGAPASDAQVEVRTPSGLGRTVTLDGEGRVRLDDLEHHGNCVLELPTIGELLSPAAPAERTAPPADLQHHVSVGLTHGARLPLVTDCVHHVIVPRPRLHRVEPVVLRSQPGSALTVPSPATAMRHPLEAVMTALDWLETHPREVMVLVGHLGPDEDPQGQHLGLDRAEALHALLSGDRGAWVDIATRGGSYHDVQHLLRYLARRRRWDCDPGDADGLDDEASRAAVQSFQTTYNHRFDARILEDGICGRQTLGALFDVLRDELGRWMDKHGLTEAAVRLHPRSPVLDGGHDWLGHPRGPRPPGALVDVLLLDAERLELTGTITPADLYEHPVATIDLLPVVHEPGDWEHGQLTVVTDLGPAYVEVHERYRLLADDGSYDIELDTAIEGVLDDGAIELLFEGIPIGPTYTLTVTNAAGQTFALFSGLRYDQFHPRAVGEELDDEPSTAAA